jgi:pimeloyl-ACP methyl ester carboxylesterase
MYEKNCIRLQFDDLLYVIEHVKSNLKEHRRLFLLAHSMGGISTILAASKCISLINGVILYNSVCDLAFWPSVMIKEWQEKGIYPLKNNRTNQELPQGKEFLDDVINFDSKWKFREKFSKLSCPFLIIHADNDEVIPLAKAKNIFDTFKSNNDKNEMVVVQSAGHTFNTKHPFQGASEALIEVLSRTLSWIRRL